MVTQQEIEEHNKEYMETVLKIFNRDKMRIIFVLGYDEVKIAISKAEPIPIADIEKSLKCALKDIQSKH